jgi:CRP-like cAMP-binding protein
VLEELALTVRIEEYGAGEWLIRQGQVGRYFFILLSGEAIIEVRGKDGQDLEVARLTAGNFLGEMSLLLNEPSSASVIANGSVEVVAIAGAELHRLLEAVPDLARRIGKAVEARRREARVREREKGTIEEAA